MTVEPRPAREPDRDAEPGTGMALAATLDDESWRWVHGLAGGGAARGDTERRLHALLLRIARGEISRRRATAPVTGPELDDLAHQAAADALLAIERRLPDFRGESRFTTWAYTFVVREVSVKLGRHFWRQPRATLEGDAWERLPARFGFDPTERSHWGGLFGALRRCLDHALTPHQRRVFSSVVLNERALDVAAAEFDLTRGAIYKAVYDSRRALRSCLSRSGYLEPAAAPDR